MNKTYLYSILFCVFIFKVSCSSNPSIKKTIKKATVGNKLSCDSNPDTIQTNLGYFVSKAGEINNYCFEGSPEFAVNIADGKLNISKAIKMSKFVTRNLKVQGGTFVGIDQGEWGGNLQYYPDLKNRKPFLIIKKPISAIIQHMNKVYFFAGVNEGGLYELIHSGDTFIYKQLYHFNEDPPLLVSVFHDRLYIATFSSIYLYNSEKMTKIISNAHWVVRANSMVILSNRMILLGFCNGLVKVNSQKKSVIFYEYQKRPKL